ncbi:hypothetical protein ABTX15_32840 [Micromonospora sp. NPDC094482]|uniref:hypothetical protein n=1 Tax=unclassified Micromonospora TaxID=2617518 RepID=UPI00333293AC
MNLRARTGIAALAILTTLNITVGSVGVANASAGATRASGDPGNARYDEYVNWYPFHGLTPNWHCSKTVDQSTYIEQACTIVSGNSYQAALILMPRLSNRRLAFVQNVKNRDFLWWRQCDGYLTAGVRVVCFAPTQVASAGDNVQGYANDDLYYDLFGPTVKIS